MYFYGNTFEDIVPELTITALSVSDTPVQVTAWPDDEKIYETIEDFVQKYNDLIDEIRDLTRYDVETEESGILLGDSTLRGVVNRLSNAVTKTVTGNPSDLNLAAHVGIKIGPQGKLLFDRSVLSEKLATDRTRVASLFTADRKLEESTLLSNFRNGEGVRKAAGQADFEIHTRSGGSFSVDLGTARTVRDVLRAINNASDNSSVTATISSDGRSLVLTDTSSGSSAFRVTPLNGSRAYNDLGFDKSADDTGGGVITGYSVDLAGDWGLGRRLVDAIERMVNMDTGTVQLRADGLEKQIEDLKKRAETMQESIDKEEERLRRQFAQLEVIMGQQQNTLQRLTAMFNTFPAGKRK